MYPMEKRMGIGILDQILLILWLASMTDTEEQSFHTRTAHDEVTGPDEKSFSLTCLLAFCTVCNFLYNITGVSPCLLVMKASFMHQLCSLT